MEKVFDKQKEGDPAKKFQATRPFAIEQDSLNPSITGKPLSVKQNDSTKSGSVKNALRRKVQPTVADMLRKENAELRNDVARLKDLLQRQRTVTKSIFYNQSKNPGIATIKKLCDGLEITITEFFDTSYFRKLEQEIK